MTHFNVVHTCSCLPSVLFDVSWHLSDGRAVIVYQDSFYWFHTTIKRGRFQAMLDGRCSISNNIAENIARPYAVGRKNFLFHDTVKGTRASSIIYSLVETAKLNKLNIYAYLETVLLYMPDYKNEPEGIEELMPWSAMIQQRCRIKSKS